jgi:hypothetical protein
LAKKILKTREIEKLEATSLALFSGLTTATSFCCPTQGGVCRTIATEIC